MPPAEAPAPRLRAPILVFGYGNPSRGDDALGPLFVERLGALLGPAQAEVELLTDFQLQIEHMLDLAGRRHVVFVDASVSCAAPCEWVPLAAARDASYSSHAMSPGALLQAYVDVLDTPPPPCTVLAIRGEAFGLGEPLGAAAAANLEAALARLLDWLGAGGSAAAPAIGIA